MPKDSKKFIESSSELEKSNNGVESVPVVTAGVAETTPELSSLPIAEGAPVGAQFIAPSLPSERRHIVKSATLVMLGNLGSSLMGMVRQQVVASFGDKIAGPFISAISPAQTFNDFLINGSINGALIPTFNDYAAPEKREELRRIVFTIVNLILLITIVSSIAFMFFAPWLFNTFLASGYSAANKELTIRYAQIIFFSLMGLGPFAVLLSALYALKEFG